MDGVALLLGVPVWGGARKSSPRSSDAQQSGRTGLFLSSWLKAYSSSEGFNFTAWIIAWASFSESSTKRNIRYLENQRQNMSLTITQSYTVTQSDRNNLDPVCHFHQYQTFPFKLMRCLHPCFHWALFCCNYQLVSKGFLEFFFSDYFILILKSELFTY